MAKLVNMALPKPKKGEKGENGSVMCAADPGKEPKFPYGLGLRLEDEEIKKLGLKLKDFDTDTVVRITAKAECTRVSEDDTRGGGKSQSLSFQITDLCIEPGEGSFEDGWDKAAKAKDKDDGK